MTSRRQVVSCRTHHESEVFGTISLTDFDDRPVSSDRDYLASDGCAVRFRDHVGVSADDTGLDAAGIVPTRAAWQAGDHRIWCIVDASTGPRADRSVKGPHA